ncbi:putative sorbitol dehydrogenase [Phaeomoniella chlamydospora]|uniref:Putative sorbitol dehydrogenase n=1 Tax=Phaeomoniella chlamydospora TaxID=158046 RepID=A0A0G2EQG2_PHACM|nr:putative sorbitol dehydrogenase [Phaeomoniella chlamydospora]
MAKMKAIRYYGKKDIRLDMIDEPQIKPGWVKIAPAYVGICGTDLHEYLGGNNLIPAPGCPHGITGETSPLTLGHEFSGVIEEVGEGVTDLQHGRNVCVQPTIYCNDCPACKRDLPNCCSWGGGLSEHVVVPRPAVWPLPNSVPLEIGALVEPLSVGYHAVSIAPIPHPIPAGLPILVLGGGPIGLAVIQAILAQSASPDNPPQIIVSEPSTARSNFAQQFGAHHIINPITTDLYTAILDLTSNHLCAIAFDCAGTQSSLDAALRCIRPRSTVVNIAVWENRATLDMNEIVFRERSYMGVATFSNTDFGEVLKRIDEGRIKPKGMITRRIKMGEREVVEEGFRALIEEKDSQVKVLVEVGGEGAGKKK